MVICCLGEMSGRYTEETLNVVIIEYSGHIFGIVTPSLIIAKYGLEAFQYSPAFHRRLCVLLCLAVFLQGVFVIGRRNHYTADVVLAAYLTPMLWNFYVNEIRKDDATP